MWTTTEILVAGLTSAGRTAGLTTDQALELARNLANVALLGLDDWDGYVSDSLAARTRQRAGSGWLLTPDRVGPLLEVLATPTEGA